MVFNFRITLLILIALSACKPGKNVDLRKGTDGAPQSGEQVSALTGNSKYTKVFSGYLHSCGILNDATLNCWGSNAYSELGNGGTTNSSTPVIVKKANGTDMDNVVQGGAGNQ